MTFDAFSFGLIELALVGAFSVGAWVWKQQAAQLKETIAEVQDLRVAAAEARGTAAATNRTLFAQLAEMKEAIGRIEDILIERGGRGAG